MTSPTDDGAPPDSDLVPKLRSDPAALEAFYNRYFDEVIRFLARRCSSPHDIADVASKTFLKVIDNCHTWKRSSSNGSARGWVFRIASNELNDLFRAAQRGEAVHLRWAAESRLTRRDVDQLEQLIRAEHSSELASHIRALPIGEREALVLVYLDQLTSGEAASVLGVNSVALRGRLSRGRRRLRKSLESSKSDLVRPFARISASPTPTRLVALKGSQS